MADAIDRTVVGWRAWYTSDRVFDSESTQWADLPDVGVLCIRIYYMTRPYGRVMSGKTLYWLDDRQTDGDIYAFDDTADARIDTELWDRGFVKEGRWTTDQEMAEKEQAMMAENDAPNEIDRVDRGE